VRFAAVVSAGQLGFKSLVPAIRPLLRDPNRSVRAAAIYALHRLGEEIDLTPLAGMLRAQDPGLRSNVALLMGLMGDASAIPMLKQAAAAPMPKVRGARAAIVRCQIAEAVVRLGDNSELNTLRASAYSTYGEVRVISINAMGAVGDERMIPALKAFLREAEGQPSEPVEVRLAAAAALARMDEHAGLATTLRFSRDANPVVRAQAAWGLGWFEGEDRAFARLRALLDDEAPMVRVAAAASVVRQAD
jgi:HEAT repeat protein